MARNLLLAALAGTIVYVLLSMTVGSNGAWGYKQLEQQRREIAARTASIQKINDELNMERMALERDRSVIAAYAHRLEYIKDNERLIKITGLRPYEEELYDTGTVLRRHDIKCMSDTTCKMAGFAFFVAVTLIALLYHIGNTHTRRSSAQQYVSSDSSTILQASQTISSLHSHTDTEYYNDVAAL